jgi:hypothetical protein
MAQHVPGRSAGGRPPESVTTTPPAGISSERASICLRDGSYRRPLSRAVLHDVGSVFVVDHGTEAGAGRPLKKSV